MGDRFRAGSQHQVPGDRARWEMTVFLRVWPGGSVAPCDLSCDLFFDLSAVLVTGVLPVTVDFCVPERIQRLG